MEKIFLDHYYFREIIVELIDGFFYVKFCDQDRWVTIKLARNQAIDLFDGLSDQIDAVTNAKKRKQPLKYTKSKYTTLPANEGRLRKIIPKSKA